MEYFDFLKPDSIKWIILDYVSPIENQKLHIFALVCEKEEVVCLNWKQ